MRPPTKPKTKTKTRTKTKTKTKRKKCSFFFFRVIHRSSANKWTEERRIERTWTSIDSGTSCASCASAATRSRSCVW
ncbi:MAG: hypothetical protein EBZ77_09500 [Chitinophagia bacterium]|nr:hypothetical protein [Chitinophagia bacterium]